MNRRGPKHAAGGAKPTAGRDKQKDRVDPDSPFAKLADLKAKLAAEEAAAKGAKGAPAARAISSSASTGKVPHAHAASAKSKAARPREGDFMDPEDGLAFHRLVAGVTPLDEAKQRVPRSLQALEAKEPGDAARRKAAAAAVATAEADAVKEHLRTLVEGGSARRFEVTDDGRRVEGRRVDVPPDAVRKLRRGTFPVDARLDLHGLGLGDAATEVDAFLRSSRARGEKCVLVIHGRGEHSPGGRGVLRGEIAAWLSQGRASDAVAAFATAHQEDGGEGAVYVLLRR